MFYYKVDILKELKERGFPPVVLRKGKHLGESTIQKLRTGEMIGLTSLDVCCTLLDCGPWDLIGWEKGEGKGEG